MGAAPSHARGVCRPFVPAEFAIAWLTFKGDLVENTDHRYVAKKDGLLSSKLLQRLYGESTIQIFADEEGEFVSREMFVCSLALCYEGNTEDRISYIFTMYGIIYGLERENEGCMLKKDYVYILEYLESYNSIPKKFYAAFDECNVPPNGMMQNSQFIEWIRKYPVLMEFIASHLPPAAADPLSPSGYRASDDLLRGDPLNNSPSCRDRERSGAGASMFGSFDFIGGEDSGDDSDEAYDSDQLDDMDEFGEFQSAPMTTTHGDEYGDGGDGSDEDLADVTQGVPRASSDPVVGSGAAQRGQRRSRGVRKMRNLTKTLGGGISKVGNVGRTILHGGKGSAAADTPSYSYGDPAANLMMAGYSFSSESQVSKNYVCGYLHKISDGKWSKRSWHRRWFVLDRQQGVLSYYRLNPANHITSTPRGNIVHMEEDDGKDQSQISKDQGATPSSEVETPSESSIPVTSPRSLAAATASSADKSQAHHMLYLNKSHPWYRGELNLNIENVSLLFEKSLARNAPTKYFFQVSTLSLQEIDSKRGVQYKLCAECEEDFDQWTLAIADVINRKHNAQKLGPKLSHQQLYRQKLIEEENRRQEELQKQVNGSNNVNGGTAETPQPQAQPPLQLGVSSTNVSTAPTTKPPIQKASSSTSSNKGKKSSPSKPNAPPRIVTYSPSPMNMMPQSQWRLQVSVEGSKQCLIVGFMLNIVALKCVAPEHALWKLLVCVGVTCAYIASVYNPPSTRRVGNGPPGLVRRASESLIPGMLDANVLSTEPTECANPETCCLHKIQNAFDVGQSNEVTEANGFIPSSAFVLPPMGGFKKFPLGTSLVRTEMTASGKSSKVPQSWATTRGETFQIRSQDYKKSKRKEPSKAALFEFLGADLLRTDGKVDLVSQRLELPEEYANDKVFIINAQLPSYGPSVWGESSCDGPGFSLILCWKIPPEVCEELKDPKSKELRLFKRFQQAGNDASLTDRFKVIAQVTNQDECGLTGMAKKLLVSHNATPVLTRPQHRFYHFNDGSTEIVVDIHAFSYIARRGIHMLLDKTAKLVIDIAFVLQGETEDELPERILGCCRLDSVDVTKATVFPR